MKRNSKLSFALHALGHMAAAPDQPLTSEQIGRHLNTNPVVVRRVLGLLRQAGLMRSDKGHAGGWRLARPAASILVSEVYVAINEPIFATDLDRDAEHPTCVIERHLHATINAATREAEAFLRTRLAAHTIADLGAGMTAAGFGPPGTPAKTLPE